MGQTFRTRWQLPMEHGAWGILYVPMLLGFIAGGLWTWRIPELFFAATGCFLARRPLLAWARAIHWKKPAGDSPRLSLIYLAVGGLSGAVLIIPNQLWPLVGMALAAALILCINTWQGVIREDRTGIGELTAIGGMTLTGPAALYAATGNLDLKAAVLWAECLLYFFSAVVYVKLRVATTHERRPGAAAELRLACSAYHAFVMAAVTTLIVNGLAAPVTMAGFVPIVARAMWFVVRPHRNLNLRQIGWSEVAFSLIFLAAVGTAFRLY